jgi:hypothetical protein
LDRPSILQGEWWHEVEKIFRVSLEGGWDISQGRRVKGLDSGHLSQCLELDGDEAILGHMAVRQLDEVVQPLGVLDGAGVDPVL